MYIKDGICYAGEIVPDIEVVDAQPLYDRMMIVTFSTGEKRLFDTTKLKGPVFTSLNNNEIFMNPTVSHGVITWDNGNIDISPEAVYEYSYKYTEKGIS